MSATDTLGFVVVFIATHHRPLSSPSLSVMMSPQLTVGYSLALILNFNEALVANGYKWCFSDGFILKIYLSSSSGTPKCLTYIITIAMFDKSKLPSMKKNQEVMVAEVVYLLGAYARNPAR